jgi:hypothetical protein
MGERAMSNSSPDPWDAPVTLGASDVMRVIKHWHGVATTAEAELAEAIARSELAGFGPDVLADARRVLVEHPEAKGSTVLAIAPYWQVRAERAQTQLERLRLLAHDGGATDPPAKHS